MTFECTNEDCGCHHAPPAVVLIDRAVVIEPGKVYALELHRTITPREAGLIRDSFEARTGATCVVLSDGIRIATEQATP
jgi:hypothetical protein